MDFVDQEAKETDAYQMMITSSTSLSTNVEQFRPGYTFKKLDRDGTNSKVRPRGSDEGVVYRLSQEQRANNLLHN